MNHDDIQSGHPVRRHILGVLLAGCALALLLGPTPSGYAAEPKKPTVGPKGLPGRPLRPTATPLKGLSPTARPGVKTGLPGKPVPGKPGVPAVDAKDGGKGGGKADDPDFGKDPDELTCKKKAGKAKIRPVFDKANVEEVVKFVAKYTCKSFILSEKIKTGKISIYTGDNISVGAFYSGFESALKLNGLAIEKVGSYYKIVETKEVLPPLKKAADGGDDISTMLMPLENVDGAELMTVLNTLKTPSGAIQHYAKANTLIVTDTEASLRRMERIIERLDTPGAGEELFMVKLENAAATDVASLLQSIFDVAATSSSKKPTIPRPKVPKPKVPTVASRPGVSTGASTADVYISKIVPDDRSNQLILKTTRKNFDRVLPIIHKLDIALPGGDARIHVHYLENAKSEELAATLAALTSGARPGLPRPTPTGTPARPTPTGAPTTGSASLFDGDVRISADVPTNSLVIVASSKDYSALKPVIDDLDIPRRQVLVEAVILEVSLDKFLDLGLVFHGGAAVGDGDDSSLILGGTALGGLSSIILDPSALTGLAAVLRGPEIEGTEGLLPGGIGLGIPAFGALLRALATDNDVNILSTPNILATDNVEAEITVGANIPVQAGFTLPTTGASVTANPIVSVQRQDIGLTLKITPSINESDNVSLEVETEITALLSVDPVTGPTLSNRSIRTTVIVPDQHTVVIGGLVEDRMVMTKDKVPVLGDIPLLGHLFKHTINRKTKTNLVVFLTPYIIKDTKSDFRKIFMKKVEERRLFLERFDRGDMGGIGEHVDWSRKTGGFGSLDRAMMLAEERFTVLKDADRAMDRESVIRPDGSTGDVPETDEEDPGSDPGKVDDDGGGAGLVDDDDIVPTGAGLDDPDPGD